MKNKLITAILSLGLCATFLVGCANQGDGSTTSEYQPKNEIEKAFYALKDNNFSIDYYDQYANNQSVKRNQVTYYTPYSLQSDGDLGFFGYAQNDDCVFSYTLEDGQVVPSTPIYNSSTGIRYDSIYDYREGMDKFDVSYLDSTLDENNEYTYVFNKNLVNDRIFTSVFFRMSYNPAFTPKEVKISIVKNVITIRATLLQYDETHKDTCEVTIFDVGKTENKEIKQYLDDGKSAKTPLNNRFYNFIAPYLVSNNFTVNLDATHYWDSANQQYFDFRMNQYFTDDAILYEPLNGGTISGEILASGIVSSFYLDSISDDKLEMGQAKIADSEGSFFTSLYGGSMMYNLSSLSFSSFIGYLDDENENIFYLTDSQLQYVLSYVCYLEIDTSYSAVTKLIFEILDYETHEFKLTFYIKDKTTNIDKGYYEATFYDLNKTKIVSVDRYLNIGNPADTNNKAELTSVLDKFKTHNYSMDILSNVGLATAYYTEKYKFVEACGDKTNNYGFMKIDENTIYMFSIKYDSSLKPIAMDIDESKNYALGDSPMTLPGVGDFVNAENDAFYLSAFSNSLYDYDNYVVDDSLGVSYWRNTSTGLSQKFLDFFGYSQNYLPNGSGFMVSNGEDPYDVRVTLLVSLISKQSGEPNYFTVTHYNVGGTKVDFIENYLSNLGGK